MPEISGSQSELPGHVEETVRSLAQLHAEHHQNATRHERLVERATAMLVRPWFGAGLTGLVFGWIAANLTGTSYGYRPLDPPPFAWLEMAVSLASLYLVILVLAAQRREDRLTQRREQLTLELAMLSEQKAAKIIQLLEEYRRDNPIVPDRHDAEASAMARPSDASSVLSAIEETHGEAERAG